MALEDTSDITQQHNIEDNTPKKIDKWFYEKTEALLREQIRALKDENFYLREQISLSRNVAQESKQTVEQRIIVPQPVSRHGLSIAEMEAIEKEKYWKAEIERREKEITQEPKNIIEVEH